MSFRYYLMGTVIATGLIPVLAVAQEPLPVRVDALLSAGQTGPQSPLASDAEFIRRIYLDLIGVIPKPAEVRAFLDDTAPNKRELLIDRLLADHRYVLHWAEVLDVLLMERRPDKYIPRAEWMTYLQTAVRQNRPWDQLAREILAADSTDPNLRPAAKFFLDRDAEPNIMARDVGRIFFGVDMQCAQCHDHPLVDHYAQSDYYGLFAFVNRTVMFNDEAQKKMFLGERGEGEADFKSVFTGDASRSRPKLPGGPELEEPHFRLGEEYQVAPADKVRSIPKYSRRAQLAATATAGTNPQFTRNIVNRVWANLFGRGLVHPVDMHHPQNPPTHPEVLELLSQEFQAGKFDVKSLIRSLVMTQAYQRSYDLPADPAARLASATEQLTILQASVEKIKAEAEAANKQRHAAYDTVKAARKGFEEVEKAYQTALQAAVAGKKPLTDAEAALAKTQPQVVAKQTLIQALTEAHAKADAAAKLAANDAELTQATAVFQNKLTAANTDLAALQKTVTDQTAAVEAAKAKWAELVNPAEAAFAQFAEAAKPWEAAKQTYLQARLQAIALDQSLAVAQARVSAWQRYARYGQQQQQVAVAQAAIPAAQTELTAANDALTAQTNDVATKQATVAEAQKVVTTAEATLTASKSEFAAKQAIVQSVGEAIAKTEQALQQLPNDAELTAVAAKLKARQEPLVTEMKAAETVVTTRTAEHQTAVSQMQVAQQTLDASVAEQAARKQTVDAKAAAVAQKQADLVAAQGSVETTFGELSEGWSHEFAVHGVKQLTPEQLAWSVFEGTGIVDNQRAAADAEIEKTIPKANVQNDPAQFANRQFEVERKMRETMQGNVNVWVSFYGAGAGQPQDQFFATADQALFVGNAGYVRQWVPTVANRVHAIADPAQAADELYLSILTRRPTDAETASTVQYLASRAADRPVALQELAWALLASAEFRFNH